MPRHGLQTNYSPSQSATRELAYVTKQLLSASLNKASTEVYKRSWKLFTEWAKTYFVGDTSLVLPISPAVIVLFLSHLYSLNYASSSVTSYLSAIGYAHKLAGLNDPTDTAIIRQLLKGYRKLAPPQDVRLPITLPILSRLIRAFKHTAVSAYQIYMLSAMCSLAFFAFLRIGEITVSSNDHNNLIMFPQLEQLVNGQRRVTALRLTISKYKHSDTGRPFVIYVYQEDSCCPVKAILDFMATRGNINGPLFCWPDGAPIKRQFFVEQLNRALRFCNLDPALYKAHSFRIGAATWAAEKGFSDAQIRQLGRWKSSAFLNYIRAPSLSTKVE